MTNFDASTDTAYAAALTYQFEAADKEGKKIMTNTRLSLAVLYPSVLKNQYPVRLSDLQESEG